MTLKKEIQEKKPHQIHKDNFINKMRRDWGLVVTEEFRFFPSRLWRLDFAFIHYQIAVEVEGGAWTGGRHTRGSGFVKDMVKYNTAAADGWLVLRATPAMLSDDDFLCLLFDTLVYRGAIILNIVEDEE